MNAEETSEARGWSRSGKFALMSPLFKVSKESLLIKGGIAGGCYCKCYP
jgi:hypothetical protein